MKTDDPIFEQGITRCDNLGGSNFDAQGDLWYPPNIGKYMCKFTTYTCKLLLTLWFMFMITLASCSMMGDAHK